MENRITLVTHRKQNVRGGVVRITKEAEAIVEDLYRATGLPLSHIVSQIIIQGSEFIDIVNED